MASPMTWILKRIAFIQILGKMWMPKSNASQERALSDYDLENIGEFTRENVEQWLTSHSGDFSEVIDFTAVCGEIEIHWSNEDNEMAYLDTLQEE